MILMEIFLEEMKENYKEAFFLLLNPVSTLISLIKNKETLNNEFVVRSSLKENNGFALLKYATLL